MHLDNSSENSSISESSLVKRLVNKCEIRSGYSDRDNDRDRDNDTAPNTHKCNLCLNKSEKKNYIILSCNHIYHIKCLVETHFIENDECRLKCNVCFTNLHSEEIMFLHSKFLSNTKILLQSHQQSITVLEDQMNQIKKEIRTCYDYKFKLERDIEKSKQIVTLSSFNL